MAQHRVLILAAVAGAITAVALPTASAQTTEPAAPVQDDSGNVNASGPSAQQMLDQMMRAGNSQAAKPLAPLPEGPVPTDTDKPAALPGLGRKTGPAASAAAAQAGTMREGSYIVNRTGRLQRDDNDELLILDRLPTEKRAPVFRVLPNLKRLAMEQAVAGTSRTLSFRVTGTVTEYRGKNWVLLTLDPDVDPAAVYPTAPAPAPAPAASQSSRTLSAEDVLTQMLRPATPAGQQLPAATDLSTANGASAVAPGSPQLPLAREGSFIFDAVGRLTKSADGSQSEFTCEADGRSMRDPPLILLPCIKMMTMEDSVKAANVDLKFRVTGLITEYRGRNYLLPDRVVVIPDALQPF